MLKGQLKGTRAGKLKKLWKGMEGVWRRGVRERVLESGHAAGIADKSSLFSPCSSSHGRAITCGEADFFSSFHSLLIRNAHRITLKHTTEDIPGMVNKNLPVHSAQFESHGDAMTMLWHR